MYLSNRKGIWYAVGMIGGALYRVSTGFRGPSGSKGFRLAQHRMVDIEHAIRSADHGWLSTPAPTLQDYWIETYRPTYTIHKRAPKRDDQVMAHALPVLGALRLNEVTPSHCERYLNERRTEPHGNAEHRTAKTTAEGTVQRERSFLHSVFRRAVKDGLIDKNPWAEIKRAPYEVRDRVLTEDEQRVFLARLSPRYQRFVLFLLGTGIRLEECRGIDPKRDLDLHARQVRVTGKFGKTRDVPIPVELVAVLKEQLKADKALWTQNPQRLREVLAEACREVEPSPAGTRPQWRRKSQTAIAHVSPHTLRHTFGWRWLKGGGDIYALSRILGHADVGVTQKHYAALFPEDLRAKMDAVDLGLPKRTKARVIPMRKRA